MPTVGDQMISEEELDRLGLPRNSLKIKHPKTGVEGYRAAVEVFHQLHCLNLLRMRIHKDYYINIYSDIQEEEEGLQAHVGKYRHRYMSRGKQRGTQANCRMRRPLHRDPPHQPDVYFRHWHFYLPRVPGVRLRGG